MKILLAVILYVFMPLLFPFYFLVLPLFFRGIRKRKEFELRNHSNNNISPFNAKVAFEISSEGELEQVRAVIDSLLMNGEKIELIFCSESVEKNVLKLQEQFPDQVNIFRLPLITYFPGIHSVKNFMSASNLVLCRYDFFPELLFIGQYKSFFLVSATLKNKASIIDQTFSIKKRILKSIYGAFQDIVVASKADIGRFRKLLGKEVDDFDFRIIQIDKRNRELNNKLKSFSFYKYYIDYIETFPIKNRVNLGNYWYTEEGIFDSSELVSDINKGNLHVAIFPHQLDTITLDKISNSLQCKGIVVYQITPDQNATEIENVFIKIKNKPGVLLFSVRGILCEMFSFYHHAFTGGGHGRSIHSVLEPYLGYAHVYCGPKTFRSTEFDLIKESSPNHVHVIERLEDFYQKILNNSSVEIDTQNRENIIAKGHPFLNKFVRNFNL